LEDREELILRTEGMEAKKEEEQGYICALVVAHEGLTYAKQQM